MGIKQILQQEIEKSKLWLGREKDESTYKRDFIKKNRTHELGIRVYHKSRYTDL
jgi:hypothetical protein